jgi:hypothetical protein
MYYYTTSAKMAALVKLSDGTRHALSCTWERYSSMETMTDRIRTTCREAYPKQDITSPFQAVYIQDISWAQETCIESHANMWAYDMPLLSTDDDPIGEGEEAEALV